jgi:hypothetical protein
MKNSREIYIQNLGAEELALAFSMINRPDMGRRLLQSISPKISNEQIEARLTSASHSLAARNLVDITENGKARINAKLEQALLPLVKFDKVIQLSRITKEESFFYSVHIHRDRLFTSHLIKKGVIHLIEYGDHSILAEYLMNKFHDFDKQGTKLKIENNHNLTLGLLGKLMKVHEKIEAVRQQLKEAGLSDDVVAQLGADIVDHHMRGSFIFQTANAKGISKNEKYQAGNSILLLAGKQNNWVFEFPKTDDREVAVISPDGRQAFSQILSKSILSSN